jgi:hypothetical protein
MSTKSAKQLTGCMALALALIMQPASAMHNVHARRHTYPVWHWLGANAAVWQSSGPPSTRFINGAASAPAGR